MDLKRGASQIAVVDCFPITAQRPDPVGWWRGGGSVKMVRWKLNFTHRLVELVCVFVCVCVYVYVATLRVDTFTPSHNKIKKYTKSLVCKCITQVAGGSCCSGSDRCRVTGTGKEGLIENVKYFEAYPTWDGQQ